VAQSDDEELTGAIPMGPADYFAEINRNLGGKVFSDGRKKTKMKKKD
jgi:hypothetical protein